MDEHGWRKPCNVGQKWLVMQWKRKSENLGRKRNNNATARLDKNIPVGRIMAMLLKLRKRRP